MNIIEKIKMTGIVLAVLSGSFATASAYNADEALAAARANLSDWMSYLPDDVYVAHVSIPGTHDSATGHEWENFLGSSFSTTQAVTLSEQLQKGIRAFDIRPGMSDGNLVVGHGITLLKLSMEDAMSLFINFLDEHPGEFLVFHLFPANVNSGDSEAEVFKTRMQELFNRADVYNHTAEFKGCLTVGDVRGKMIFLCRENLSFVELNSRVGALTYWPGDRQWSKDDRAQVNYNDPDPDRRAELQATDVANPKNEDELVNMELSSLTNLHNYTASQGSDNLDSPDYKPFWSLSFTGGFLGSGISSTAKYLDNAVRTNPHLAELIRSDAVPGPAGIVLADWVLVDTHTYSGKTYRVGGNDIVTSVIENNFDYIDRFIIHKDASTTDPSTEYFLVSESTGLLLSSGAKWGTKTTLGKYGVRIRPVYRPSKGATQIGTTIGGGVIGLGGDDMLYNDFASGVFFDMEKVEGLSDVYVLKATVGGTQMALTATSTDYYEGEPTEWSDGTTRMADLRPLSSGDSSQRWKLVAADRYIESLCTAADEDNPADISDIMPGHRFWGGDSNNSTWAAETKSNSSITAETRADGTQKETLLHCLNNVTGAQVTSQWTLEKTVTGLPAGRYELSFLAAECGLKDASGFSVKINGEEVKEAVGSVETNSADDAVALFLDSPESYTVNCPFTLSAGESFEIRMTNGRLRSKEASLFLDNFTLLYFGPATTAVGELPADTADTLYDIYTTSGVRVASQVRRNSEVIRSLARGVYILRSATTTFKIII